MKTKTQTSLSALDKAIQLTGVMPKKMDNEFTAEEFSAKSGYSKAGARNILGRQVKEGKMAVRATPIGNFFSIVE